MTWAEVTQRGLGIWRQWDTEVGGYVAICLNTLITCVASVHNFQPPQCRMTKSDSKQKVQTNQNPPEEVCELQARLTRISEARVPF